MTPMARTEPAAKFAGFADGHAAQVGADADHDEPLGLLDAVGIGLRVAEGVNVDGFGFFDLRLGAVADEDGFTAPFDDYLLVGKKRGV